MEGPLDFKQVFDRMDEVLREASPNADDLRAIRRMLADPAFHAELLGHIDTNSRTNMPSAFLARVSESMYLAEERRERQDTKSRIYLPLAIGGGTSMLLGAIFSAVTLGPVALIVGAGATATIAIGYRGLRVVDPLRLLARQIAESLGNLRKKLDNEK